jgi:hypothetical protein
MASIRAASAAVGLDDAEQSAHDAAEQMLDQLGTNPDVVLVFTAAKFAPDQVLKGLWSRLSPRTKLVGCTSDVEVDARGAIRRSVSVTGLALSGIEARTFQVASGENESRGKAAASALGPDEPSAIVAFPDVLESNGTRFLLGLQNGVGKHVPIVGGAPAASGSTSKTYSLCEHDFAMGGTSGVALYGPVQIVSAARSGYTPVGARRTITKVDGTAILEFDGTPALDAYLEHVGTRWLEDTNMTSEFPLGVVDGPLGTQVQSDGLVKLVRAIFRIDRERKALILGGDLPAGAVIRVLRAGSEDVLRGAEQATQLALAQMVNKPDLALIFSCISRRATLGPRYRDECKTAFSRLPEDTAKGGFYTFGELSPVGGITMHHESTFTIALLRASA